MQPGQKPIQSTNINAVDSYFKSYVEDLVTKIVQSSNSNEHINKMSVDVLSQLVFLMVNNTVIEYASLLDTFSQSGSDEYKFDFDIYETLHQNIDSILQNILKLDK